MATSSRTPIPWQPRRLPPWSMKHCDQTVITSCTSWPFPRSCKLLTCGNARRLACPERDLNPHPVTGNGV
jgi:hypothetical protein